MSQLSKELFSSIIVAVQTFFLQVIEGTNRFYTDESVDSQIRFSSDVWEQIQAEDGEVFKNAMTNAVVIAAKNATHTLERSLRKETDKEKANRRFHQLIWLLINIGVLVEADSGVQQEKPFFWYSKKLYVPSIRGTTVKGDLSGTTTKKDSWQEEIVHVLLRIKSRVWPNTTKNGTSALEVQTLEIYAPTVGETTGLSVDQGTGKVVIAKKTRKRLPKDFGKEDSGDEVSYRKVRKTKEKGGAKNLSREVPSAEDEDGGDEI